MSPSKQKQSARSPYCCYCTNLIFTDPFPLSLDNGRSPHVYINQRQQIQFRAPTDERCAARNMFSLQ